MKKTILIIIVALSALSLSFDWDTYKFSRLDGQEISYRELSAYSGKSILFFWTSWCYYCRAELKRINECPADYGDIEIYYVNLGEDAKAVKHILKTLKLPECVRDNTVLDERGALAYKFNIIGVPLYVFFKEGKEIHQTHFINKELINKVFSDE